MSWWWAGGAAKRNLDPNPTSTQPPSYSSVALVISATRTVGTSLLDILPLPDTPACPWKVYSISEPNDALSRLSSLSDITHLFSVAAAIPSAHNLQHVCLHTGHKHYVAFESLGKIKPHEPPFQEDLPGLN